MKKINIILLVICSSICSVLSQNDIQTEQNNKQIENTIILQSLILKLQDSVCNIDTINYFFDFYNKKSNLTEYFHATQEAKKNISNELKQYFFNISLSSLYIRLNIAEFNGNIYYMKLYNDTNIFFEKKFYIKDIPSEFRNFMYPSEQIVFGSFCGYSGMPSKKCEEMLEFIKINQYKQLSDWLYSDIPEIAAYGYEGIFFLSLKGIVIEKKDVLQMKKLQKSNMPVIICNGCKNEIKKLSNALKKDILKYNYSNFLASGWLN
jgi:hypothetical protein